MTNLESNWAGSPEERAKYRELVWRNSKVRNALWTAADSVQRLKRGRDIVCDNALEHLAVRLGVSATGIGDGLIAQAFHRYSDLTAYAKHAAFNTRTKEALEHALQTLRSNLTDLEDDTDEID